MTLSVLVAIVYGAFAIAGGVMGYAKARSKPSLISGLFSGVLLLIGAIAQQQGNAWGWSLSLIVTLVLIVVFAIRFWKTRKFMPAGLMIFAGVATLIGMLI